MSARGEARRHPRLDRAFVVAAAGLVALAAHAALYSVVVRRAWIEPLGPAPPAPPSELSLPWIAGVPSALFVAAVVLLPAATAWMQRRWERPIEPLALVALALACLGLAAAAGGALAIAERGDRVAPVNLVGLGTGLLIASAVAAAAALARIARGRRPGALLALGCLGCAVGNAWIVQRFLVDGRFPPLDPSAPALAVVARSRPDRWDPREGERVTIDIRADGRAEVEGVALELEPEPLEARLAEVAARLGRTARELPDGVLRLRADERAEWEVVEGVLFACRAPEVGIWKVHLATRWAEPPRATRIAVYMPRLEGFHRFSREDAPAGGPVLALLGGGRYRWLGSEVEGAAALGAALAETRGHVAGGQLTILPAPGVVWGEVLAALERAMPLTEELRLGRVPLQIP